MPRNRNTRALWLTAGLALALATAYPSDCRAPTGEPSGAERIGASAGAPGATLVDGKAADTALIARLRNTRAANIGEIIARQFVHPVAARGFGVPNPYPASAGNARRPGPVHHERVQAWLDDPGHRTEVCAIRFLDTGQTRYELRSFASIIAAEAAGYRVTHQYRCGSCSALSDLATYLENPDLTSPARDCARRWTLAGVRQCLVKRIGFSDACAESWAYNAINTRHACRATCIEVYGLLNLLLRRYPAPNNNPDGKLNACLQCDEDFSGPGFKYSAGRTRRGSGIRSAIARQDDELFPVDHSTYFAKP